MKLAAGCDALGHIRLRVVLRNVEVGSEWRLECSVCLEAGQLEKFAQKAGEFFG